MKICVVGALHGNELFGLKVVGKIHEHATENVMTLIGHPQAIAKGKRYIDEDLNRCFGKKGDAQEIAIAKGIEKKLRGYHPDVVLDIHTSISDVGNIAIVAEYNEQIGAIAAHLDMDAIVIMPKHLTNTSLIGIFPEKSISLEFGKNKRSDQLAYKVFENIQTLEYISLQTSKKLPVYEVYSTIDKSFKKLAGIKNLTYYRELQGYPFLAGTGTYETMGGFIARKLVI